MKNLKPMSGQIKGANVQEDTVSAALRAFRLTFSQTGDARSAMRMALYATMRSPAMHRIDVERCGIVMTVEWDEDHEDGMSIRVAPGTNITELVSGYAPGLLLEIESEIEDALSDELKDTVEWMREMNSKGLP